MLGSPTSQPPAVVLVADGQFGNGASPVAQFMEYLAHHNVIGFQLVFAGRPEFGDQEHGNALDTGRCTFDAAQHEMHHIVHTVMIAGGDEDFLALDSCNALGRWGWRLW